MNTQRNTVMITGAASGIGLAIAKAMVQNQHTVILVGRNEEKLKHAAELLNGAAWYACDLTDHNAVDSLVEQVVKEHPELNILINNAGYAGMVPFGAGSLLTDNASREINTNYLAVLNITEKLLPHLKSKVNAVIVNNSSITGLLPSMGLPTYSISKAALHAYTQLLRLSLIPSNIKVFELMPPLVDTAFAKAIASPDKLTPQEVAEALMVAMKENVYEIHMGVGKALSQLYLHQPEQALMAMNKRFLTPEA